MDTNSEHMYVEFHEGAVKIFYALYRKFESDAAAIDRNKKEFLFRQLKDKYVHTMKQELEEMARNLLKKYQHNNQLHEADQHMNQLIKNYLHQFVQKAKSI